uniref:Protein krueppel n=1 Tax=Anopheles christyi TaxID=43041 RepID=A0A182K9B3_9DIPT
MKCFVSGCDTDDNVVSYTSVFYVNCPTNPTIQQQWFTLLEVTDPDAMRALVDGEAKVCSCHFTEECFGHHPAYGYRYLLSTALPTIFPPRKDELKSDSTELVKDPELDYFLVYLDEASGPTFNGQMAPEEATHVDGLKLIENLTTLEVKEDIQPEAKEEIQDAHVELLEEANDVETVDDEDDDDEAIEQIGIEYANGKYYFLKLDDDPVPTGDALVSTEEGNEREDSSLPVEYDTFSSEATAEANQNLQESDRIINEHNESEMDEYDGYQMDVSDSENELLDAKIEHEESRKPVDGEEIEARGDPEATPEEDRYVAASSEEEYDSCSEPDTEQNNKDFVCDALSEADYGPIEALEEVSVCGDKVRIKNEGKDRFCCEFCGRGFRFKSLMERHSLIHTKVKKFFCEVCGKGFSQKINLNIHMRTHTGEVPHKKYTCQICEKKCIRLSELETHMTAHLRKFPHVCPLCTQRYSDATGFYDHFLADHRNEMTVGELIELLAQNENVIVISDKNEPANIQREDGWFECGVCGKTYRMESNLERHKRKMHVKIFYCPHCPRKFLYKSLLTKHLPTHTLDKPFQCPHCPRSYTQRVNLKVHMKRKHSEHAEPSYVYTKMTEDEDGADDAGESLVDDLLQQTKVITGPRTYDCEMCGKRFPRSSSLMQHVAAHKRVPNPVTYDCEVCGMSLSTRVALGKHRWRLHGEQRNNINMIRKLELRNVTILPTEDNQYVEIDATDTISEDYENEY